jgi:hypothetical protein
MGFLRPARHAQNDTAPGGRLRRNYEIGGEWWAKGLFWTGERVVPLTARPRDSVSTFPLCHFSPTALATLAFRSHLLRITDTTSRIISGSLQRDCSFKSVPLGDPQRYPETPGFPPFLLRPAKKRYCCRLATLRGSVGKARRFYEASLTGVFSDAGLSNKIGNIMQGDEFKLSSGRPASQKELAAFMYKINFLTARKEAVAGGIIRKYFEENRYLSSQFADFGFDWEIHPAYRWALQPDDWRREIYTSLRLSDDDDNA